MKVYKNPIPTVDAIIQKSSDILLITRKKNPFKDYLALPGGFVNEGETVEFALKREVFEETSLIVDPIDILGVYSDPTRDPRGHIMTVVFICIVIDGTPSAGDDAKMTNWISINDLNNTKIAFDHKLILNDYLKWRNINSTFWTNKHR